MHLPASSSPFILKTLTVKLIVISFQFLTETSEKSIRLVPGNNLKSTSLPNYERSSPTDDFVSMVVKLTSKEYVLKWNSI